MNPSKRLIGLALFIMLTVSFLGGSKPSLQVSFKLCEPKYIGSLQLINIPAIENEGTKGIIAALRTRFEFLEISEHNGLYNLNISLGRKESQPTLSGMHEVGFKVKLLDSDNKKVIASVYWKFRGPEVYDIDWEEKKVFITAMLSSFNELISEPDLLVKSLFSNITLCERAFHYPKRPRFILPFTYSDAGIGEKSKFLIEAKIDDDGMIDDIEYKTKATGSTGESSSVIPPEYLQGKIVTEAYEPTQKLGILNREVICYSKKIYILKYNPLRIIEVIETPPTKLAVGKEK